MTKTKRKNKLLKLSKQLVAPRSKLLKKSFQILQYAYESTESLWRTFIVVKKTRNPLGVPTHAEQDLLRAVLIFSCSGLDSLIKQIFKDAYPTLVKKHDKALLSLQRYAEKKLVKTAAVEGETSFYDAKILASLLLNDSPKDGLIRLLIDDVVANSLQSHEEIMRVVNYLGADPIKLSIQPEEVRGIFNARNRIIHEMDIDFDAWKKRRQHKIPETQKRYRYILSLGVNILSEIDLLLR